MKKPMHKSKTFWGALLLSIEAVLQGYAISFPIIDPIVIGLGSFLTIWGIRDALK